MAAVIAVIVTKNRLLLSLLQLLLLLLMMMCWVWLEETGVLMNLHFEKEWKAIVWDGRFPHIPGPAEFFISNSFWYKELKRFVSAHASASATDSFTPVKFINFAKNYCKSHANLIVWYEKGGTQVCLSITRSVQCGLQSTITHLESCQLLPGHRRMFDGTKIY